MSESEDIKFMQRCLDLAAKAEGMTYPNPLVGSVVVHNGIITGEGFHLKAGGPHAEVNAINSVHNPALLRESVLYVNLEPCSHFGRTPPCSDLIISSGIPKVVIGTPDTSDKVSGKGIGKLRNAGCEVITGVLEKESRRLNRRFFTFHEKKRPYITLKWAQSADGFIDMIRDEGFSREPNWITGKPERVLVHKWRSSEQAILVGANTIRADNPGLNVREWKGNDPLRLILSRSGKLEGFPVQEEGVNPWVIFTNNTNAKIPGAVIVTLHDNEPAAKQISDYLWGKGIQSLFIEGGAQILMHFISSGFWDEARVFHGLKYFNLGVKAPFIEKEPVLTTGFSMSRLEIFYNT